MFVIVPESLGAVVALLGVFDAVGGEVVVGLFGGSGLWGGLLEDLVGGEVGKIFLQEGVAFGSV